VACAGRNKCSVLARATSCACEHCCLPVHLLLVALCGLAPRPPPPPPRFHPRVVVRSFVAQTVRSRQRSSAVSSGAARLLRAVTIQTWHTRTYRRCIVSKWSSSRAALALALPQPAGWHRRSPCSLSEFGSPGVDGDGKIRREHFVPPSIRYVEALALPHNYQHARGLCCQRELAATVVAASVGVSIIASSATRENRPCPTPQPRSQINCWNVLPKVGPNGNIATGSTRRPRFRRWGAC
jgi:hypothetical protein